MSQALRIIPERRTGKDRRRVFSLHRFFYKGPKEEKPCTTVSCRKKDEMVGL